MHNVVNKNCAVFARAAGSASVHNPPMTQGKMDIAWFKAEMKRQGVTQDDVAAMVGRDRSNVSKILNGKNAMELNYAKAFAKLLGLPVYLILERAGTPLEGNDRPSIDKRRLARAMAILDKVTKDLDREMPLEERVEFAQDLYLAEEGTPDAELERDIYRRLLRGKTDDNHA